MATSVLRNWVGLFLLGTINNLPYVVVTSAASTIATSFGKKNLIGLVFGANVGLSAVVKVLNGAYLLNVPYWIRYIANAVLMLIGLFGVAYAPSFWFSLVCILFVGASAAFGENVALGYLRLFPSKLVNAWSSGTGMAGVLGSLLYVVFGCVVRAPGSGTNTDSESQVHLRHLTQYAFLLTSPFVGIYLFSYFFVIKTPTVDPTHLVQTVDAAGESDDREPLIGKLPDTDSPSLLGQKESYCQRIVRCIRLVWWLALNLFAVYLFEYVAQGCAAKVRPDSEYHVGCPELYAGLSLCYQAGVFVSRSSVQLMKIRRVEILSVIQLVNMLLWIIDVHYQFLPVAILPSLMVFVGLLGGASYVNIFYLLLHDDKYPEEDRELCINITALFITFGIVGGTVFETLLFLYVL